MSRLEKAIARLKSCPANYAWRECVALMRQLGYTLRQGGGGSHCDFYNKETDHCINLYRPHPGNEMKRYLVRKIITTLEEEGLI